MLELVNFLQTAGTHLGTLAIGAIGAGALFLKKYGPLIKRGAMAAENAFEHLKKNLPAIETAKIAEQVATLQAPDEEVLREAKTKDALKSLAAALRVEIGDLSSIALPMIQKYLSDKLPEYKDYLTPANVAALMQVSATEVNAARAHDGVKMMQEILAYLQQAAPVVANKSAAETPANTADQVPPNPEQATQLPQASIAV